MAKIPEYYEIGNRDNLTVERLLEIIEDMYRQLAVSINSKPDLYQRDTDGQADETFLDNGTLNLNTTTQNVEMLVDRTLVPPLTVTWKAL